MTLLKVFVQFWWIRIRFSPYSCTPFIIFFRSCRLMKLLVDKIYFNIYMHDRNLWVSVIVCKSNKIKTSYNYRMFSDHHGFSLLEEDGSELAVETSLVFLWCVKILYMQIRRYLLAIVCFSTKNKIFPWESFLCGYLNGSLVIMMVVSAETRMATSDLGWGRSSRGGLPFRTTGPRGRGLESWSSGL